MSVTYGKSTLLDCDKLSCGATLELKKQFRQYRVHAFGGRYGYPGELSEPMRLKDAKGLFAKYLEHDVRETFGDVY